MDMSQYNSEIFNWFTLPADLKVLAGRPWTLFTFMFTHSSIWHLVGNMLFLWAFGFLLQDLTGNRHIVPLYFYGSLAGALLFVASVNLVPLFYTGRADFLFLGAGAATMAIAIATTVTTPDYRVFPMINGGIPIWVLTFIYVVIDFAGLASAAFPHHLAHIGGAVTGFLYIKGVQRGKDPGAWMHGIFNWFMGLFDPSAKKPFRSRERELFYNTNGKAPYKKTANITQQRIDEILDKISKKGVDALTTEEKDILKKASDSETA
jgi:membrane associated rhomboid family serine protease